MNDRSLTDVFDHLLFDRLDLDKNESTEDTPERIAKAWGEELVKGLNENPGDHLTTTFQTDNYDELITMTNIDFYSLCEHHFLPFFGEVHVGYIADQTVTGLSKIPRMVETASAKPHMQERLTNEIRDCLDDKLNPQGVMVVVEAEHLCMKMRGVEDSGSVTKTSALSGEFRDDASARNEFLAMIND